VSPVTCEVSKLPMLCWLRSDSGDCEGYFSDVILSSLVEVIDVSVEHTASIFRIEE
jgi:hypothetical protein